MPETSARDETLRVAVAIHPSCPAAAGAACQTLWRATAISSGESAHLHRLVVVLADMRHRVLATVAPVWIHCDVHHLFTAEEVKQLLVVQLHELERQFIPGHLQIYTAAGLGGWHAATCSTPQKLGPKSLYRTGGQGFQLDVATTKERAAAVGGAPSHRSQTR